jgi:hypothetical protein
MLGVLDNFPQTIHRMTCLASLISNRKLQQTLTEALQRLNKESVNMERIADPLMPQCSASFEFGIAETDGFNYLDDEEANRVLKMVQKNPFETMDFFCCLRYHRKHEDKPSPLRFDYYLLRFTFEEKTMDVLVFHERGPRHLSPEDLTDLVVSRINEVSQKKTLRLVGAC